MLVELATDDAHIPLLRFPVAEIPVKVGRSNQAAVQLAHPLVSRLHCEIYVDDNCLRIRDLGSTNQTLLNDVAVHDSEISQGDELVLGGVRFTVRFSRASNLSAAPGWTDTLSRNSAGSLAETLPQGSLFIESESHLEHSNA